MELTSIKVNDLKPWIRPTRKTGRRSTEGHDERRFEDRDNGYNEESCITILEVWIN